MELKKSVLAVLAMTNLYGFDPSKENRQWDCEALGKQSVGGPVGDIYIRVHGHGATEFEATNDALVKCLNMGLQMCMVRGCYQSSENEVR